MDSVDQNGARIPVALLGATGMVGQRFAALLEGHPRFEVVLVAASERSAGRTYGDACRWKLGTPMPERMGRMVVGDVGRDARRIASEAALVFSALDSNVAGEAELEYAESGTFVVSNASAHRMDHGVPLVVPEVNGDHLELVRTQSFPSGGGLVCNPNCSTIGLVMALAPLHRAFGVESVAVTTLQAASGAGYPGVAALDLIDNVVPFIPDEEEKLVEEPAKILGVLDGEPGEAGGKPRIRPAALVVSPQCFRVPVSDGHSMSVSVKLKGAPSVAQVRGVWEDAGAAGSLRYTGEPDRPQPRLDREFAGGLGVTIGRLRACPLQGVRFVALSHNTVRGAAGGAILVAEAAVDRGLLDSGR